MSTISGVSPPLPVITACAALGMARASFYRHRSSGRRPVRPRPAPARALRPAEKQTVLDLLHSDRFVDQAPASVFATLLDEGVYHCSVRTMYRLLAAGGEVRERRDQLRHPQYAKPELLARGPNQVWSWDITRLKGPAKWTYFYLYVILDIFSRYVVGWMVARQETAALAKHLIAETIAKQDIDAETLTLHADRGSPMKAKPVAFLLAELGVTKSHSRPHTSNDNPFSESQFKTMKYRPDYPKRFGSIEDARAHSREFFEWYNTEHCHSGIGLMTPQQVHYGDVEEIDRARRQTLEEAYRRNPDRFVRKKPAPPQRPEAVWINPPSIITTEGA
ncbi:MAG: IS3 family transposase [bacterium]|nr:IS3 family transposase [bacterium]